MWFGSTEYQAVTENKAGTSFLSLPTEVRIMVYDYSIEDWPGLATIHKGCGFPGRSRHTSYPHRRIDADCSISAPTPSILPVSRQITSEALHIIRLKYPKSIVIDYLIATLAIDEKTLLNFSNVMVGISFGDGE